MWGRDKVTLSFLDDGEGASTKTYRPEGDSSRVQARAASAPRSARRVVRTGSSVPPRVMIFDVSDLIAPQQSFVAPEMNVLGSNQDVEWPEPQEAQATIDEDQLLDLLRASIPEELLTDETTMSISGGRLIVTNPAR